MNYRTRVNLVSLGVWVLLAFVVSLIWNFLLSQVQEDWAQALMILACYLATLVAAYQSRSLVENVMFRSLVRGGIFSFGERRATVEEMNTQVLIQSKAESLDEIWVQILGTRIVGRSEHEHLCKYLFELEARFGAVDDSSTRPRTATGATEASEPASWDVDPSECYEGVLAIRTAGGRKIGQYGRLGQRIFEEEFSRRVLT